jgi:hypothetical protein
MSSGSDNIIEFRQFDDVCIIIILEERLRFQLSCESRLQMPSCLFLGSLEVSAILRERGITYVVFLDNLLEPCVIELDKLC